MEMEAEFIIIKTNGEKNVYFFYVRNRFLILTSTKNNNNN